MSVFRLKLAPELIKLPAHAEISEYMNRPIRHLVFALVTLAVTALSLLLPYENAWERVSIGSAWLCMAFLVAALSIGPLLIKQGKSPQLNIHLRRDIGIWSALTGLQHFVAGNVVAMSQDYIGLYVRIAEQPGEAVREQMFSVGSILGTLVALLFLLLLCLSSDRAMRLLGVKWWKRLQLSAHGVLWLTVAHGIAFQLLEARYAALFVLLMLAVVALILRKRPKTGSASAG